ncbi:MAG TPA: glycosyltransferase family 2 protein, partial [Myxococcaceae bacterium]
VATGGWEHGPFPEDYALWMKLLHAGYGLRNVAEVLLRWRDSAGRLTRTDPRYDVKRFTWVKARYLALGPLAGGRPCTVWGAGPSGLVLTRFLREEGVAVQRFVDVHPRKVGTRVQGIPVVAPEQLGPPGPELLVVCVGVPWARQEIRADLTSRGWVEGVNFLCAA